VSESLADLLKRVLAEQEAWALRLVRQARRCSDAEPSWHPLSYAQRLLEHAERCESEWGGDEAWVTLDPPRVHFRYARSRMERRVSVSSAAAYRIQRALQKARRGRGPSPFMQMLRRLPPCRELSKEAE
jgi:hypothetical protein